MRTDERVRSMCLHHLRVGVLPASTHDFDLMMNTQYPGLDFKFKPAILTPGAHMGSLVTRMRQFLLVKQPENLCNTLVGLKLVSEPDPRKIGKRVWGGSVLNGMYGICNY